MSTSFSLPTLDLQVTVREGHFSEYPLWSILHFEHTFTEEINVCVYPTDLENAIEGAVQLWIPCVHVNIHRIRRCVE